MLFNQDKLICLRAINEMSSPIPIDRNTEDLLHYLINEIGELKQKISDSENEIIKHRNEIMPTVTEDLNKTNKIIQWIKIIGSLSFISNLVPLVQFLLHTFRR